jgi:hypothetical protein
VRALYTVTQRYQQLAALLGTDEVLDEQALDGWRQLDEMREDIAEEAHALMAYAQERRLDASKVREVIERLQGRAELLEKRADMAESRALEGLRSAKVESVPGVEFSLAVRANPWAVKIINRDAIPANYWRQPKAPPREPDKVRIKAELQAGAIVPGCELDRTYRLEVR